MIINIKLKIKYPTHRVTEKKRELYREIKKQNGNFVKLKKNSLQFYGLI
jgi:hypothetical protein